MRGAGSGSSAVVVRDKDGAFRVANEEERCVKTASRVALICFARTGRAGAAPVTESQPPRRLSPNILTAHPFVSRLALLRVAPCPLLMCFQAVRHKAHLQPSAGRCPSHCSLLSAALSRAFARVTIDSCAMPRRRSRLVRRVTCDVLCSRLQQSAWDSKIKFGLSLFWPCNNQPTAEGQ